MRRKLLFFLFLVVSGCQSGGDGAVREQLALQLTFPRELAPQTHRYRKFLPRVRYLEIAMTTKAGQVTTKTIPPGQWNAIPLLAAPLGGGDGFTLQARIWDNTADGRPRTFPVLTTPVRKVSAAELQRGEPVPVHLRFNLHVPEREWD